MNIPAYSIFKTRDEVPYSIDNVKIAAEKKEFVDYLKKGYRDELPELQARIKNIAKRLVLFVGGNPRLMKELGALYHCASNGRYLCYYPLLGKAEKVKTEESKAEVDELFRGQLFRCKLNPDTVYKTVSKIIMPDNTESSQLELATLECRLQQDCTIFFDCLGCSDTPFLQWLSKRISDIKSLYDPIPKGHLIISSLTSLSVIPAYFRDLFEVVELEKQPTGATVNNTPLCFTYNKQSRTLTTTNNHGNPMKLSKQRAKLFDLLKKPKDIRLILKKLYSKEIEKNQKITDGKRNTYDSLVCKFNKSWRKHFDLNEELELIKCENEIVSILQNIDWK